MVSAATSVRVPALPAERFFQGSLLLLIGSSIATLIATGKLDPLSCVAATVTMAYKAFRWWRRKPVELSPRTATMLVVSYLVIFPLDILFFSRAFVATSTNPSLFAALLGAVHFLLFVMLVRLYSAATDRDAFFLAILAFSGNSGGGDFDRGYLVPGSLLHFSVVRGGDICGHGDAARRKGRGCAGRLRSPRRNAS